MSANEKKVYRIVAFSAAGAVGAHVAAFLFFAMLVNAGYFAPPPPDQAAEQYEITFVEEVEEMPVEEEPLPEEMLAARQELRQNPAFIDTQGLTTTEAPPENAPFYSDRDTRAASELPASADPDAPPMPSMEGFKNDIPSQDLLNQEYTEGEGTRPQPEGMPVPPQPAPQPEAPEAAKPEEQAPAPQPTVAETPPEPEEEPIEEKIAAASPPPPPVPEEVPAMPEARLPAVPEVLDIPESEDAPEPEALAAVTEPVDMPKSEEALKPEENPEFKPDPEVLALLDLTRDDPDPLPKPMPEPQREPVPEPPKPQEAEKEPEDISVEDLLARQRNYANPGGPSNYNPQRRTREMAGSITQKGKASVDAAATPLGRYDAEVNKVIERNWRAAMRSDAHPVGSVTIRFIVPQEGGMPTHVQIARSSGNTLYDNACFRAVSSSKLPPIPPDVIDILPRRTYGGELTFGLYDPNY